VWGTALLLPTWSILSSLRYVTLVATACILQDGIYMWAIQARLAGVCQKLARDIDDYSMCEVQI